MKNYNKREHGRRVDHSQNRPPKKASTNIEKYSDVTHAHDGCNAMRLGRPVEPNEKVTCNKCRTIKEDHHA
jgi:hypothetical protein